MPCPVQVDSLLGPAELSGIDAKVSAGSIAAQTQCMKAKQGHNSSLKALICGATRSRRQPALQYHVCMCAHAHVLLGPCILL